jgi:hypothetical protein
VVRVSPGPTVTLSRHLSEGLNKITENLNHDDWCCYFESKLVPHEYKSCCRLLEPLCISTHPCMSHRTTFMLICTAVPSKLVTGNPWRNRVMARLLFVHFVNGWHSELYTWVSFPIFEATSCTVFSDISGLPPPCYFSFKLFH